MHIVAYGPKPALKSFYPIQQPLARPGSLPHLFRKLRQNRNLTKKSLAFRFGVKEEYISQIESGLRFPSLKICLKFAKKFEINPEYIKNRWVKEAVRTFEERLRWRLNLFD